MWGRGRGRLTSRECVRGWGCEWSLFNCSFYHPCPHITPPRELAARLWGDIYYQPDTRLFRRKPAKAGTESDKRTFVQFVLEPLYKIYSTILGEFWSHCMKYTACFWVRPRAWVGGRGIVTT